MNEIVISGLVKRRSAMAGEIEQTQQHLVKLVRDLEALDEVILQFEPSYELATIKAKAFRPPEDWSRRGEMGRVIMGILRQAAEPLSTRDITVQLFTQRALNQGDEKLFRLMTKRVGVSLRDYRIKGVVESLEGPGMYNLWRVTGPQ